MSALWKIPAFRRRLSLFSCVFFFFFNDTAPPDFYTLPLHAALPIWISAGERDAHFLRVEVLDARCEQPPRQVREQRIDRISRLQEELPPEFASPIRAGEIRVQSIEDRKSTRLNSSHLVISYAVFCLK